MSKSAQQAASVKKRIKTKEPSKTPTKSSTKSSKVSKKTLDTPSQFELVDLADDAQFRKIVNDTPPNLNALQTFSIKMKELRSSIQPYLHSTEHDLSSGISFLQLRYQLLHQYNMNLLFYLMLKNEGISLEGHPVVDRLVQIRVFMERIKPILTQLQYQIDQLLSQSSGTVKMSGDATTAGVVGSTSQEQSTGGRTDDEKKSARDLYFENVRKAQNEKKNRFVDAKDLEKDDSSLQYQDRTDRLDVHQMELKLMKEKEKKDKIREKALYSTLVRELRSELSDKPEELSTTGVSAHRMNREQREKLTFEEDNYMRLQLNKKEKKKQRQLERMQGFDDVDEMADYSAIVQLDRRQKREQQQRSVSLEQDKQEAHDRLMSRIASNMMKRKRDFD